MRIAFCIDGTGAYSDDDYNKEMGASFVHQISQTAKMDKIHYTRGPTMLAMSPKYYMAGDSGILGANAFLAYLRMLITRGYETKFEIYITGYSRGAMIATYIANRINDFNTLHKFSTKTSNFFKRNLGFAEDAVIDVKIKSMVLFDSVDSDVGMAGPGIKTIPACVEKAHHFICLPRAAGQGARSRAYFNRINLEVEDKSKTDLQLYYFDCTHSAIGGLPGQGDHFKPGPSTSQAAMTSLAKAQPLVQSIGIVNPALGLMVASGAATKGALSREFDKHFSSSGVTLAQDWDGYRAAYHTLGPILDKDGWNAAIREQKRPA